MFAKPPIEATKVRGGSCCLELMSGGWGSLCWGGGWSEAAARGQLRGQPSEFCWPCPGGHCLPLCCRNWQLLPGPPVPVSASVRVPGLGTD